MNYPLPKNIYIHISGGYFWAMDSSWIVCIESWTLQTMCVCFWDLPSFLFFFCSAEVALHGLHRWAAHIHALSTKFPGAICGHGSPGVSHMPQPLPASPTETQGQPHKHTDILLQWSCTYTYCANSSSFQSPEDIKEQHSSGLHVRVHICACRINWRVPKRGMRKMPG